MNTLLQQQLKQYMGNHIPKNLSKFLSVISESYDHHEKERVLFESSQQIAHIGSWELDVINYQLILSNEAYRILGYAPQSFIATLDIFFTCIHPDDAELMRYKIEQAVTDGIAYDVEHRIILPDGTEKVLQSRSEILIDSKTSKPYWMFGTVQDITSRKEAEIALRDSEYRFRSVIQHSSDAMLILNEEAEVIFSSDSLFRITGYKPAEVIGDKNMQFIHPDHKNIVQNTWNELLKSAGATKTIYYKRLKKDGSYIWCEGVITNLMHEPAVGGMIVNFRDITERMEYLDALRASNKDLKKSNMELDRFVYSVSHDLRAPLSSMLGVLQLIQSEVTDPSVLSDLGLLEGSIKKLDGFILDILDYSKNARLEIKKDRIAFDTMVADVLSHLKYMGAGNPNIDIKVNINEDFIIHSDKDRINIILNNLISNAIRYSNPAVAHPLLKSIFIHIHRAR
jgi:PAS domain S-box-containing protein